GALSRARLVGRIQGRRCPKRVTVPRKMLHSPSPRRYDERPSRLSCRRFAMLRTVLIVAVFLGVSVVAPSQTSEKKKPADVEATFANASVVRVTLLAEKIEVDTVYGKLSVPVRDVRRIEFGMRLPEGADKKIETAIKQLA